MHRSLDRLGKGKHLDITARRILDLVAGMKSGDVVLRLVDGRAVKPGRTRRLDSDQTGSSPGSKSTCRSASDRGRSTCPV
jgi:hypothetical protein